MHHRLICRPIGVLHYPVVCLNCLRVLVEILGEALDSDVLQYGFKKNCSISHALYSFGESVRYFTSQRRFTVYHWMPVRLLIG